MKNSSPEGRPVPFPDYDKLDAKQVGGRLAQLSQVELAGVESYERAQASRVLPTSPASAREKRSREAKATLLREGYADRERTAPDRPE